MPKNLEPASELVVCVCLPPQETRDMAEKKTKLMTELEREKEKLERDIQQLTNNKVSHNSKKNGDNLSIKT